MWRRVLQSPWRTSLVGLVLATAVLAYASLSALDLTTASALAVRAAHVLAAMVWAGLIVFVNIVQLAALKSVSEAERPLIVRHIAGPTAWLFTGAAHATLLTGLVMMIPLGATAHSRVILMLGVLGGLAMWAIVQFVLRPNVARLTGRIQASADEKAAARATVYTWARINLILVIPVSVAMIIAAHAGL